MEKRSKKLLSIGTVPNAPQPERGLHGPIPKSFLLLFFKKEDFPVPFGGKLDGVFANCDFMPFMHNTAHMEENPLKVPAGEFQRNIGRYQDIALTKAVSITRNGRERTVLISADEYYRLKRRDRRVLTLSDFADADIAALEATRAPESSKAFDGEVAA